MDRSRAVLVPFESIFHRRDVREQRLVCRQAEQAVALHL